MLNARGLLTDLYLYYIRYIYMRNIRYFIIVMCVSSCVVVTIIIIRTWVVLVCELQFSHNPGYIIIQLSPSHFNWHPIVHTAPRGAYMSRCSNTTLHNSIRPLSFSLAWILSSSPGVSNYILYTYTIVICLYIKLEKKRFSAPPPPSLPSSTY